MIINFQNLEKAPIPADENWWIAFIPIVVVIILFYFMRKGILAVFTGNRFIAKIFRISKEQQLEMMKRFEKEAIKHAKENRHKV